MSTVSRSMTTTMTQFLSGATLLALVFAAQADNLKLVVTDSRLPNPVSSHVAVYDGQDSVYVLGGFSRANNDPSQVVRYSLDSGAVSVVGRFQNISYAAAVMHGEDIIFFGGQLLGDGNHSSVYRFSTRTGSYDTVGGFPMALYAMSAVWDARAQVAYIFGGLTTGHPNFGHIYRYNASDHQIDLVARLPGEGHFTAAAWDQEHNVAYVFGGYSVLGWWTRREVSKFEPLNNFAVTMLGTTLPQYTRVPSASFVDPHGKAFIVDWFTSLMEFDAASESAEAIGVDDWQLLYHTATVYVPKLDRMYILGGYDDFRDNDQIAYIDFGAGEPTNPTTTTSTTTTTTERPPSDCSDGGTRPISDPFCCERFYFCFGGEATRYDCPDGQHFNPRTSECADAALVGCRIGFDW